MMSDLRPPCISILATPVLRPPLPLLKCSFSGCNIIRARKFDGLSLKRGFGGCGHGFDRCDGDELGGLCGFDGFSGFGGFDGLGGFCGFDGFSGFGSLKVFSVSFTLLLNVIYLLVRYPLSYKIYC